jgi:D-alanyl-D-alanine carboxypeptidase/D-alanyl-D-alanine-endopeptidase (penicillin-binding protein 4)
MKNSAALLLLVTIFFAACSTQHYISKQAKTAILQDATLSHAHVGISLYDPAANKYWYNHLGDHYFVPASNTKIVSCYAMLKHIGDSLPGLYYAENDTAIWLIPTGDPTLLHPDFTKQPVIDFIKNTNKSLYIVGKTWQSEVFGSGWSWNDYNEDYMPERSALPVYGNVLHWVQEKNEQANETNSLDRAPFVYSVPEINWKVRFSTDTARKSFYVQRNKTENVFVISQGTEKKKEQDVPFVTHGLQSALELLKDATGKDIRIVDEDIEKKLGPGHYTVKIITSQPTDSMLRPMMHRSDNFFAEQSLMMVSNEMLKRMSDRRVIDSLLKTDLKDLPHTPRWADGSGLSRYNLFTPQDFVVILHKMEQEFGMTRLKNIFPTGGRGTLGNFYKQDSGFIYAKTGTLSGVVALSGYLYTKKNKFLIFSVLVNNHYGNAVAIRKRVEAFLQQIRNKY